MNKMQKKVEEVKKSGGSGGNPEIVLGLLEALLGSANGSNHLMKVKIHALSKEKKDISGKLETAEKDLHEAREKNNEMKKKLENETKLRRKDRTKLKKLRREFDHFKESYESKIHEWKTVLSPGSNLPATSTAAASGRVEAVRMQNPMFQPDNSLPRLRMANTKRAASSTATMPPLTPKKKFMSNIQNSGSEIEA